MKTKELRNALKEENKLGLGCSIDKLPQIANTAIQKLEKNILYNSG